MAIPSIKCFSKITLPKVNLPQAKKAAKVAVATLTGAALVAGPVGCKSFDKAQAAQTQDTTSFAQGTDNVKPNKEKVGYLVGGGVTAALATGMALAATGPVGWTIAGVAAAGSAAAFAKGYFMENTVPADKAE